MHVGLVVNPRAGRRVALDRAKQAARELTRAGCKCEIVCTTAAGSATELARDLAAAGCRLVFAAGGDGTINEVVQGLVGSGAALGVIPAGLANVWALDVGLRSHPGDFAGLLRHGRVFDTDLGLINGRYFLMMAGIGFDAQVVAAVDQAKKARWAQLAYVAQAAVEVRRWPATVASVTVDRRALETGPLFGVIVTNVNKYGGVVDLAPHSKLDDGRMDALIWSDGGLASRVRSALFADYRPRRWDPRVTTINCSRLSVLCEPRLPAHTDAEIAGCTPCDLEVVPRALPVLLPASAQSRYLGRGSLAVG